MRKTRLTWTDIALATALCAFAIYIHLHYGTRDAIGDIDYFFDFAWRLHQGQAPFLDFFMALHGFTLAVLQAAIFKLRNSADVYSLVLHASVINGAAVVCIYILLRAMGLNQAYAAMYAGASALVFYPYGVPMPVQHSAAFLVAILALQAVALGGKASARVVASCYTAAGFLAVFGFLAKPIPLGLLFPASFLLWLLVHRSRLLLSLGAACAGVTVALAALWALLGFSQEALANFYDLMVRLPYEVGTLRQAAEHRGGDYWLGHTLGVTSHPVTALVLAGALIFTLDRLRRDGWRSLDKREVGAIALALNVFLVNVEMLRVNGDWIWRSLPMLFLPLGLAHAALLGDRVGGDARRIHFAGLVLVGLVALDSVYYTFNANAMGGYHGQFRRVAVIADPTSGVPGYEGITHYSWRAESSGEVGNHFAEITEEHIRARFTTWRAILDVIAGEEMPVVVVGFPSFLFALVGELPLLPVSGSNFGPGYTAPAIDNPVYRSIRDKSLSRLTGSPLAAAIVKRSVAAAAPEAMEKIVKNSCARRQTEDFVEIRFCGSLDRAAAEALLVLRGMP